jgi:hypothetical protein
MIQLLDPYIYKLIFSLQTVIMLQMSSEKEKHNWKNVEHSHQVLQARSYSWMGKASVP